MISTIDFVFLKLWLLWHGKIYSDRCWPVDIPWSFCIVLLLVRLNVSMAIVQGFTVSWYQRGKRCGTWKNCTSFQEFILKKWTSEVWKNLEVRDMVGKFVGNEAAKLQENFVKYWHLTQKAQHSESRMGTFALVYIILSFPFLRALVKCADRHGTCRNKWHVMTTDDKWLISAIFLRQQSNWSESWRVSEPWMAPAARTAVAVFAVHSLQRISWNWCECSVSQEESRLVNMKQRNLRNCSLRILCELCPCNLLKEFKRERKRQTLEAFCF